MPDFERHAAMAIRVGRALAAGATLDEIMRADDVEDDEEAR
jgi:hypothetical protein